MNSLERSNLDVSRENRPISHDWWEKGLTHTCADQGTKYFNIALVLQDK